ncbi:MAG: type II secretion system F family protein [Firmicutes bacterium]|nr:type II secretion system F family protein [Bacillota bacterium]
MPNYLYRARDNQGQPVSGDIDADHQAHAVEKLRARGYVVTHLELNRDIRQLLRRPPQQVKGRVPLRELAVFSRQFGTMLGSGVPINTSLRILARQTKNSKMVTLLDQIRGELEAGGTLATALGKQAENVPPVMINLVAAGEVGGFLEDVFYRLAEYFEKEDAVAQKVRSALTYPATVVVVAFFVIILMVTVVLPNFANMFTDLGANLPWPTRFLLGLSAFVRRFWYLLLLGLGLLAWGTTRYFRTPKGRQVLDRLTLRLPIFGDLLIKRALARFSRTLGTLLKSGVPLLVSLAVVERTIGNSLLAQVVGQAQTSVRGGRSMIKPLEESRYFPPMIIEMMGVGEETGAMEDMLYKVADFYEKEIDRITERLTTLIEPVIIAVLGLVVGFILVSMYLPMFDVFTLVK